MKKLERLMNWYATSKTRQEAFAKYLEASGNRWKRRMGWVLFQGSCMHSGWEYDCCCEPRSYYVDWHEVIGDRRQNKVRTMWYGTGQSRQRRGYFVQDKYWAVV